ncbi:MAG: DUF6074 family protein [Xanthobacteraceae bacterium]
MDIQAVIPFPMSRRHALVHKLARQMLDRSPVEAEKHLTLELSRHERVLRRRRFPEDVIASQVKAFECAVRAVLWRLVISPPPRSDQRGRR